MFFRGFESYQSEPAMPPPQASPAAFSSGWSHGCTLLPNLHFLLLCLFVRVWTCILFYIFPYPDYFRFYNFQFLNWFWICSPNSFPDVGVLAGLVKGLVVVGHLVVAKWWSPFAAIYMTWWCLLSKTHPKIVETNQHNMFRFYKSLTYWIHIEEDAYWTSGSSIHLEYRHGPVYMHSASRL